MPIYMESDVGGDDFPGNIKAHIKQNFTKPEKETDNTQKPVTETENEPYKTTIDPMRLIP